MALEKKEVVISNYKDKETGEMRDQLYLFTKLTATKGLEVQIKLQQGGIDPNFIKDVICSSVSIGSTGLMKAVQFDDHFSGRLLHLMDVFGKVIEFNFDENFTESDSVEN